MKNKKKNHKKRIEFRTIPKYRPALWKSIKKQLKNVKGRFIHRNWKIQSKYVSLPFSHLCFSHLHKMRELNSNEQFQQFVINKMYNYPHHIDHVRLTLLFIITSTNALHILNLDLP